MNFAQKVASTVVSRMLLEMDALPKGSGNVDQAMALVGMSNAILKGIEGLRDADAGTNLELSAAHVGERSADEKDPLEGMSESKVDFDNPVPVPSLVAAVEALVPQKKKRARRAKINLGMRVRMIHDVPVVSLEGTAKMERMALPLDELKYGARMPNVLARIGKYAIPETMLGPLLGFDQNFFATRRKNGMPCHVAHFTGTRRYIRIRDGVAHMKMHNKKYGLNKTVLQYILQAISNN